MSPRTRKIALPGTSMENTKALENSDIRIED